MFRIALSFCAGAAALHALAVPWWTGATWAAAAAAVAIARRGCPALAAAAAGFGAALLSAQAAVKTAWPCARDGETVVVVGTVAAPPLEREGRTDFDLVVERTTPTLHWPGPRRLRLAWYEAGALPRTGELWQLPVKLRCPRGFANPGAPDRELMLRRERTDATGYVAGGEPPRRLSVPQERPVQRLRERIAAGIADAVGAGPSAAVLQGLAVGVRGNIPDALWEAFAVTGVAHLVAISGLHVTGCAACVLWLLRLAWRLPATARLRARIEIECAAVFAATAAYAALSGASVPALRTLVTVGFFIAMRAMRRALPLHHALAASALVIVAGDPLALASAGFWLSFVATAVLLAVIARDGGWSAWIGGFARAQLAISTALAPVLLACFGRISLLAPLVNAVAVPAFGILVLPPVLAATVVAAVAPDAAAGIWRATAWLFDRSWTPLQTIAAWPIAGWAPALPPTALVAAAGAFLFAALLLPLRGLRCAAAAVLLAILCGRAPKPEPGAFEITVVDVGQGLAAVVETAGHVLVFDTGPRWRGGGTAAQVSLLPLLRARGANRIDRMIVSHDDADHSGGAALLAGALDVRRTNAPDGAGVAGGESCAAGLAWDWDGVGFRVLHPAARFEGGDNDRSCAVRVSGAGGTALLLADPEAKAEAALRGQPLAADFVLLPHHGSRSSSSPELVAAVRARLGVASAGYGNRWNLPHGDVVARWREAGTTVLETAREGAVRVRFGASPGEMAVETERRDRPRWWRADRAG
jgi:competence protein ComEC